MKLTRPDDDRNSSLTGRKDEQNFTPADVYFNQDHAIIERKRKIKSPTIPKRRFAHHEQAA